MYSKLKLDLISHDFHLGRQIFQNELNLIHIYTRIYKIFFLYFSNI